MTFYVIDACKLTGLPTEQTGERINTISDESVNHQV